MRSGDHREWTDRMSAYLEDGLDPEVREELEDHLAVCGPCRRTLAELREVVALARGAGELRPPEHLWLAVASRLGTTGTGARSGEDGDVIALPTARTRATYVSLSPARLGAAAAALVLLSAGATWWIATEVPSEADLPAGATPLTTGSVPAVAGESAIPEDLAAQLGALEDVLATARSALDPATVVALERNLETIEAAIADSRRALATDPGNAFLREHLERMYRRKLVYLQDAVRVAEWTS